MGLRKVPFEPFIRPACNVCGWLASKSGGDSYAERVARNIRATINPSRDCFAISTFLPGITADDEKKRNEAVEALRCVLKIARAYNEQTSSTKICVIEMVCGGRISSRKLEKQIEAGKRRDYVVASLLHKEVAIDRILHALTKLSSELSGDISVALELEPGPLFALSQWSDLVDVARALEASDRAELRFGFNCDIAHWSLADITADQLLEDLGSDGPVGKRVVHAHISDFGKGHLGDIYPTGVHNDDFFEKWLWTIKYAFANAAAAGMKPSGWISIELELPESLSLIRRAIAATSELLHSTVT